MGLYITERFLSIQGESFLAGRPAYFVRLSGCNLRCKYCDTTYSFSRGFYIELEDLIKDLPQGDFYHVVITGGEPLLQKDVIFFMGAVLDRGKDVVLFTNGTRSMKDVPEQVIKVVDIKTPWAEKDISNKDIEFKDVSTPYFNPRRLQELNWNDEVKFVVRNRVEFEWAKAFIKQYDINKIVRNITFSPELGHISPVRLWDWIRSDRLNVRLGIQIHKCFNFDQLDNDFKGKHTEN